ncbi:hypothetical protein ACP70R_007441 [Stipagrostis hirtigluma subsp. patula]
MEESSPPVYHDGCPGCAVERRKENQKGVPYRELFFVGIITLVSFIRDVHIAQTEQDIGFYAGFLGASYLIGRGLTSIFWGMVADRIGRKPVNVKYWVAITTRLLLGALNGLTAPIKAYSIEVCRTEHQALGLSIVNSYADEKITLLHGTMN